MIIGMVDFLTGECLPDPLYNNVLFYPDMVEEGEILKSATARILMSLDGVTATRYSTTFSEPVPCLAETPTSLSIVFPASSVDVNDAPYCITWERGATALSRYTPTFWFVDNVSILSQGKIRVDLVRDEWSNDWPKYTTVPVHFSRRHAQRWKRAGAVYKPIYNGLSDPEAESMVFSKTHDEPLGIFGSNFVTVDGEDCPAVMVWRYIRFATRKFYLSGTLEDAPTAIRLKENVPTVAYPLGICYRKSDSTKTYFRKFEYINDGTNNTGVSFMDVMAISNSYIADSFISTRPPCPFTFDVYFVDGTTYLRAKAVTTAGNPVPVVYGSGLIKYGADTAADSVSLPGGMVYDVSTPGSSTIIPSFSYYIEFDAAAVTLTDTETKIDEAPYSTRRLKIGTANVDISPAPNRAVVGIDIPYLLGTSAIITGDGKEIAEIPAWWNGLHTETINDALQNWLIANRNTFEQGKNWQLVNTLYNAGVGLVKENYGAVAGSFMGGAQQYVMNAARVMDLKNTPGAVTIPSGDAFDNLPHFDHPVVSYTKTDTDAKNKILAFWRRYGYPDNSTAAINDVITRTRFVYLRGVPERYVPGILNARQSWFGLALSRGLYVWRLYQSSPSGPIQCALNSAADVANITNTDDI